MTGWPPTTPTLFWDYVSDTDPTNENQVEPGEKWFDTANAEGYVYNGNGWDGMSVAEYNELAGTIPQPDVADDTIITRMVAANAITNTEMADNSVDTAEIVADAVTNALIAANAVDTPQVANDAITAALIAADAVQAEHIGADQVQAAAIAAGAVGTGQIDTDAVTNSELADNSVDSAQIVADAVDLAHISTDLATQAELNSHAGNSTAHHSKPNSTQPAGSWESGWKQWDMTAGYQTYDLTYDPGFSFSPSQWEWYHYNEGGGTGDAEVQIDVTLWDGSVDTYGPWTVTVGNGRTETGTFNAGLATKVRAYSPTGGRTDDPPDDYLKLKVVETRPHAHTI